jgi:NADPH:quinone reductase-like Zn-dependent oxidoreductase
MYKNKEIKPQITASFPLKDAAKALASVEQRKSLGKVVLTMK